MDKCLNTTHTNAIQYNTTNKPKLRLSSQIKYLFFLFIVYLNFYLYQVIPKRHKNKIYFPKLVLPSIAEIVNLNNFQILEKYLPNIIKYFVIVISHNYVLHHLKVV